MELPDIGLACTICNRNDYLPFKCSSCNKIVCIDHRADHGVECPLNQTNFVAAPKETESLKQACDFCHKITLKLELSKCDYCPGSHCLYHRHQVQHNCPKLAEDKVARDKEREARIAKQQEALDRLKAIISKETKLQSIACPKQEATMNPKSRALARRVRLMKMKQSATCPKGLVHDTSILTDQDKLFLEVKFVHEPNSRLSSESLNGKSVNIWTSPKWTVGQTLDYPAHLIGAINKNHIESSDQLVFRKPSNSSTELIDLDNRKPFQKYLDDQELESGDVIYLTYALK